MPILTVMLGRTTLQVLDLDQPTIVIGREEGADIVIDNPSMSRRHAEIRQEGGGWTITDMGSSNGTFMDGSRIEAPHALQDGDEIGFGKFSVVFGKIVGNAAPSSPGTPKARPQMGAAEGTMHIKAHEVKELLKDSENKRRAHFVWEAAGRRGTHYLSEAPAVLVGTDSDLCDVVVPKGPRYHLLILNTKGGCAARYLAFLSSMKVNGRGTRQAHLKDGDVVEANGLKLTFVGDIE